MFIKIKSFIINVGNIRYVQVDEKLKSINIVFSDEENLIFSVKDEVPSDWLNTPQFEILKDFFISGECNGYSQSLDILNPLNN